MGDNPSTAAAFTSVAKLAPPPTAAAPPYIFGKDGLTAALKAGPEYEVVAENRL
ncbi:MAG: hypothetical protein KF777_13715 [Planctomycetaceae bacterium]|nr:hypothetical protein [Planctomycetaceae bacterium]